MAAPTFKSAGTLGQGTTGTSGTVAVPIPAGVSAGDLMVMQYHCQNAATPNTPSGWSLAFGPIAYGSPAAPNAYVFIRISAGSEPSTVSVTRTGSANFASAIISVYSGTDATTPIDVYSAAGFGSTGSPLTSPTATTTKADTLILRMYWAAVSGGSGSDSITPATGTERYDTFDANFGHLLEVGSLTQASVGATGTSTATISLSATGGVHATIALAPPTPPAAPVANFTGTPLSGAAPMSVTFTDTSTGTPTSWAWDFGDGGTSTSQNPSHSYTNGGAYTVTLTATNAGGSDSEVKTGYVAVAETIVYAAGGGIEIH